MFRNAGFWASLVVLIVAVATLVVGPQPTVALRNLAFDTFQRWQPRAASDAGVRIVDIDDDSLRRLGQWPWPRSELAAMVTRLADDGAAAIAFDVIFSEADMHSPAVTLRPWAGTPAIARILGDLPDFDTRFAKSIQAAPVALGFSLTARPTDLAPPRPKVGVASTGDDPRLFLPSYRGAVPPLAALQRAAAGLGALNFTSDSGGVIRRVPALLRHGDDFYPALWLEALRLARGARNLLVRASGARGAERYGGQTGIVSVTVGDLVVPTDASGHLWLHYARPERRRYLPAWKLLAGELAPGLFKGAVVFVGSSAAGLKDLRFTPFGAIPGVEVHAQAAEQVLQGTYLTRPDWATAAEALFLIVLWLALVLLIARVGALLSAVIAALAVMLAGYASWYAFSRYQLLVDPLFPTLTAIALYVACSLPRHMQTERQQRWIREAFSTYISPNLVAHLIDHPDALSLGGERRECSFVMTDLAGFTALVERSDPTEIVALLNGYLDGMIAVALAHEGTLDRIIGDAVAVMFSAPVEQPDHAARAVACALAMDAFASDFARAQREQGLAVGRTRIGVNSGQVIIGNVGGEKLFDYRALGDAVNTTSRLEGVNRQLGTNICISGATVAQCPDFTGRPVGTLVLAGKSEGVPAFEPLSPARMNEPAIRAYLDAYRLMEAGDSRAPEAFRALAEAAGDDPLARFHAVRLAAGARGSTIVFESK